MSCRTASDPSQPESTAFPDGFIDPVSSTFDLDALYDEHLHLLTECEFPTLAVDDLQFAELGMEDLLLDKGGRRLSIEFSRRMSLGPYDEEEPEPKRRKSETEHDQSCSYSYTSTTKMATPSEFDDDNRPQILSLLSPKDLEIYLQETKSRLADSMKRSALSRRHINDKAAELASSDLLPSNSCTLLQSGMHIASFISNVSSKTF